VLKNTIIEFVEILPYVNISTYTFVALFVQKILRIISEEDCESKTAKGIHRTRSVYHKYHF